MCIRDSTKMLSRMVNGQAVVVIIICIINTTRSVSCNCKASSDALLESFKLICREIFSMITSCYKINDEATTPSVPITLAES